MKKIKTDRQTDRQTNRQERYGIIIEDHDRENPIHNSYNGGSTRKFSSFFLFLATLLVHLLDKYFL